MIEIMAIVFLVAALLSLVIASLMHKHVSAGGAKDGRS